MSIKKINQHLNIRKEDLSSVYLKRQGMKLMLVDVSLCKISSNFVGSN